MKNLIEILSAWGKSLSLNLSPVVATSAIAQNEWFSLNDIRLAITAIDNEMLQPERLEEWLSQYNIPAAESKRLLIVMAGNIPLVGFFDLLCVVAAGHTALVKPSHKDHILIEWAISELKKIEPSIPIYIYDGDEAIDYLIATGSEITRKHFESCYPDTPTLLRGTRHSLAIISEQDDDLEALSEDIFSYSGLGCRNVSMLFVPNDFDLSLLPKGVSHTKHHNNYLRTKALLTMNRAQFTDSGTHCLIESHDFSNEISLLSIYRYSTLSEVQQWIESHDEEIQCIVANSETINHPRRVDFGRAQHPTLFDYADGVDTMNFLLNI